MFPELALTTFFPRWYFEQQVEVDAFFERAMPGPETQPLFDAARRLGVGFYLGYAELADEDGRDAPLQHVDPGRQAGPEIVASTARSTCPATPSTSRGGASSTSRSATSRSATSAGRWCAGPSARACSGLFGMAICNDRRWPETYRVMGLQGVEMVLLGYNTPVHNPPAPEHDALSHFHNELVMQSGAYQNGTWVVGVAKAGNEEGVEQIGNSIIVAPSGEIVAACTTTGDELAIARCDLDLCNSYKTTTFNFARHREPEQYRMIVERKGAVPPE